MSIVDQIVAERFGAHPDLRVEQKSFPVRNASTVRASLHTVRRGPKAVGHVFEKTSANRPLWARTTPEAMFYERVLPHWPFMQAHACALYAVSRTPLTTTIYTSAAPPKRKTPLAAFRAVAELLPEMHRTGAELIESGALDPAVLRALDYYRPPPRRRVHADHGAHVARVAQGEMASLVRGRELTLFANLSRLAAAARKAPRTICHLDLLGGNFAMRRPGPILIDWGETRIAPTGFDYGGLLAGAARTLEPEELRGFLRETWSELERREPTDEQRQATLSAAYYFLIAGLVRYLAAYRRAQMRPDRLELIVDLIENVGHAPASAGALLAGARLAD